MADPPHLPEDEDPFGGPVELPIDGELDLHLFSPKDVKDLLHEYLPACREKGILEVRIIHGKGSGALRRSVQSIVSKLPYVRRVWTAGPGDGGWGATWVALAPQGE